jgi:integrase/recombinase XerD
VRPGACHLFRHTAATLVLEGGADIRYIQQFLGHADLNTIQLYTHVSIGALKAVHDRCHPAASSQHPRWSGSSADPLDAWESDADDLLAALDDDGEE